MFPEKSNYCLLYTSLAVAMQKTKEPIYLPLSNEALKWMPKRGDKSADEYVFKLCLLYTSRCV